MVSNCFEVVRIGDARVRPQDLENRVASVYLHLLPLPDFAASFGAIVIVVVAVLLPATGDRKERVVPAKLHEFAVEGRWR